MKKKQGSTRLFQQITSVFITLMCTVFLLTFDGTGFEQIASVKLTLFYVICGGYVALMLLLLPESILVGTLKAEQVWRLLRPDTWVQKLALVYLGLSGVAALLSAHDGVWLGNTRQEGLLTIAIYVLCFYFVSKFAVADQGLLYIFGTAVTIFAVICILQLNGLDPFGMYPGDYNYFDAYTAYAGAYLGTIGNVDFVAAFLCIAIPVFGVAILRMKEKQRFVLLLPLFLSLWVLTDTAVLAGLVGILCGGALALPIVLPISKKAKSLLWVLLGLCAVGGMAILYFADIGEGFLHEMHLLLHGKAQVTFGSGRLYIWKNVLEKLGDGVWFGHGPDTLSLAGIEPFERYDQTLNLHLIGNVDAAHNEYLNILYHQGIFALLAYLGMLTCAAVGFIRRGCNSTVATVCGSAVLCYCVQAFFGISQFVTAPFLWLALGVLESAMKEK